MFPVSGYKWYVNKALSKNIQDMEKNKTVKLPLRLIFLGVKNERYVL